MAVNIKNTGLAQQLQGISQWEKTLESSFNMLSTKVTTGDKQLSRFFTNFNKQSFNAKRGWQGFADLFVKDLDRMSQKLQSFGNLSGGKKGFGFFDQLLGGKAGAGLGSLLPTVSTSTAPVKMMASGGVFNAPALGMVAEVPGQAEAVVPLPDGRSIPIKQVGGGEGAGKIQVTNINVIDPRMIESVVADSLVKNKQVVLNIINENYRSVGNRGF